MSRPAESALSRLRGIGAGAALLLASACASPPATAPTARCAAMAVVPDATGTPAPAQPSGPAPVCEAPAGLVAVLSFADKLRSLDGAALQAEIDLLQGRAGAAAWLQLSLAHARRQPPDLQRAIELAQLALQDPSPEGRPLQALARLLQSRLTEQRRLEEQLERQGRQQAELQRRLDHSLERLEALKAIERSLERRQVPARGSDRLP